MDPGLASYLFALLNAGSFVGRVLAGAFAQHVGQFNMMTIACYASAILLFCWLKITSSAGLIFFSLLFGATSGIVIALMMSTVAHTADHPSKVSANFNIGKWEWLILWFCADTEQIGTYISMSTFVVGFAGLAGTPIAGALIGNHHGYTDGIIFSAAVIMAGAVIFTGARYAFAKDKLLA